MGAGLGLGPTCPNKEQEVYLRCKRDHRWEVEMEVALIKGP